MNILAFDESIYFITDHPESDDEIAFDTYEHYLASIVDIIHANYQKNFISHVSREMFSQSLNKNITFSYLKRFLYLGWNTECLLKINDSINSTEILRVNNQWKPIQVYYSIYSLCEAAYYALTNQQKESHASCLRSMSDFLITTPLPPWNFGFKGYIGNSKNLSTISSINFSQGLIIPNSLSRISVSPEQVIACCLQAEHKKRIQEHKRQKKEKYKYLYNPGNTTLLHFLYRLRIKSNYKNVGIFLAKAPDHKLKAFSLNLTKICTFSNALFEVIIASKIGKDNFIKIMEEFVSKHSNTDPIEDRLHKYCTLL